MLTTTGRRAQSLSFGHAPRGVAAGEDSLFLYLVPVANRPVCVTRVRAA